jgi:hypothetical protein
MKKLIIALAALTVASSAYATDLPLKKKHVAKHPAAVAAQVAPVAAPAPSAPTTSVSADVGVEVDAGTNDRNKTAYTLGVEHQLGGGAFIAGQVQRQDTVASGEKDSVEGSIGYKLPVTSSVDLKGSVGVGERWVPGDEYSYYVGRLGADVKLSSNLTWNAVQYRYRDSFDSSKGFESHQIGTGVTYKISDAHSVYAKVYRSYDKDFGATDDGVLVGYKFSF